MDDTPSGIVGVSVGPAIHTGRSHVVDGVSGATRSDTVNNWKEYALNTALFADMGIPTSRFGMSGTLGLRFLGDMNMVNRIASFAVIGRYRFRFRLSGARLSSIEPWIGVGVGFHKVPEISTDVFVQLPLLAGCDFGMSTQWIITTEIQLNAMNPIGPTRYIEAGDSPEIHKLRYDSYIIRMGIAYRFY
ncbi:MAG: hypothetical protein JXX29_11335 [Deltaproteobacteria bacterium]|nr:hypothetical protein [Deltaproteobacteria bacterium]MBN2672264.1 hypothetical protein [Deltaproteobacteria bacterium]